MLVCQIVRQVRPNLLDNLCYGGFVIKLDKVDEYVDKSSNNILNSICRRVPPGS